MRASRLPCALLYNFGIFLLEAEAEGYLLLNLGLNRVQDSSSRVNPAQEEIGWRGITGRDG
jgi:hypothetical protein